MRERLIAYDPKHQAELDELCAELPYATDKASLALQELASEYVSQATLMSRFMFEHSNVRAMKQRIAELLAGVTDKTLESEANSQIA